MSEETADFGLIVSFTDQSESFVLGFEAGILWERMQSGKVSIIETTIHSGNIEVISRQCIALGWSCSISNTTVEGWVSAKLIKVLSKPLDRPNPKGLYVVKEQRGLYD